MVDYEKGKGWWATACWTDSLGKRHRKYKSWFLRKRDAEAWVDDYLAEHSSMTSDADEITLAQFLAKYLNTQTDLLAANTLTGYAANITAINHYIGQYKLQSLKKIDYELAFKSMAMETVGKYKKKPLSPGTIEYRFRTLHTALAYAVESGYLKKNPIDKLRLPMRTTKFQPVLIPDNQIGSVLTDLKCTDSQLYYAVLLSVVYGLRRGEALGLRWCDIDFDGRKIHIKSQYTRDGKNKAVYKEILKTSSSYRILPLVEYVAEELQELQDANKKSGRIATYICELDGRLPSPNAISHRWTKYIAKAGFPEVRYHDLRHASAMIMIRNDANVQTVKNVLGHSQLETTERYLHFDDEISKITTENVVKSIFAEDKTISKKKVE